MTGYSTIGKNIPRLDAAAKVTGRAKFASDYQEQGMLWAKILRSPYPHAKIKHIDTVRAEKLPGVRAIITGKDLSNHQRIGMMISDYLPLACDKVRWAGEPVAAVAADSKSIAEEALELIDVDYEEIPAVFDPEEAMHPDCPVIIHPDLSNYSRLGFGGVPIPSASLISPNVFNYWQIINGDTEAGFKEADLIVQNRYSTQRISHGFLEPRQADAWLDQDGILNVRAPRQGVQRGKGTLCKFFNLPFSKVRMIEPFVGGAFGGRVDNTVELIAALFAFKTRRHIRLVLSREEDFTSGYHKAPFIIYVKDGVKKDGTLVAREIKVIIDGGAYSLSGVFLIRNSSFGSVGTYRIPNFSWKSYGVYTNYMPSSSYRGFGAPDVEFAVEQQMDIIAEKLGIDPVELRLKNILKEGERNAQGQITESIGAQTCLEKVNDWWKRNKSPQESGSPWRRGRGIALGNKYSPTATTSCVHLKVNPDHVFEVYHGVDALGQGINTVCGQIVAEEFGVSPTDVRVVWGDSAVVPYDWASVGSRSTWQVGNALRRACHNLKQQILELAGEKLGFNPYDLVVDNWRVYAKEIPGKEIPISELFSNLGIVPGKGELVGKGEYTCPKTSEDPSSGQGERLAAYYTHGAYVVELAVNMETGEVKIEKVVSCFDMGQPINPKMCEQQIEGGAVQVLGYMLYEEMVFDHGKMVNSNLTDYKIPTAVEIPNNSNVKSMFAPVPHAGGPFGAKGLGEAVLCPLPAAVANAIYAATGKRFNDIPFTREKIWDALKK